MEDLSLSVAANECLGLLGPNGAGKTTTLSVLTGEVTPTAGSATIKGYDIATQRVDAFHYVGYCPQFDALIEDMTCAQHLRMYAIVRGVPLDAVDDRYVPAALARALADELARSLGRT